MLLLMGQPNKLRLGSCWYRAFILVVPPQSVQTSGGPSFMGFLLTRAAGGAARRSDFVQIRGTERLLSPPLDSSDASATSRLQRFSDFPAMAYGPAVLGRARNMPDVRRRAPQGRRRNPMPEVSRGRDGRRQSEPRPHRRAAAEPPVVIPFPDVACTYCRAEAWPDPRDKNVCIRTTYPAANRRSKSAHN